MCFPIRVKDTGVGICIHLNELPRVFDPFFRVDDVRTQTSGNPAKLTPRTWALDWRW